MQAPGWGGVEIGGTRTRAAAWVNIEDAVSDAEESAAVLYDTKFDARRAIVRTRRGYYADIPYSSDLVGLDVVGVLDEDGFREV